MHYLSYILKSTTYITCKVYAAHCITNTTIDVSYMELYTQIHDSLTEVFDDWIGS